MIERPEHLRQVFRLLADFLVVAIVGARQTGKTTLAARIAADFAGAASTSATTWISWRPPAWCASCRPGTRTSANAGSGRNKVYLADSGLLHALLDVGSSAEALLGHPRVGASWEGFVLHQIVRALGVEWRDCHHWRLHTGAELDLLVTLDGRRLGFEIKRTDAPRLTPSMRSALELLRLERLYVIHAGDRSWPLAERADAVPLGGMFERLAGETGR